MGVGDRRDARVRSRRAPGRADRRRPGRAPGGAASRAARGAPAARGDVAVRRAGDRQRRGASCRSEPAAMIGVHLQHQFPAGTVAAATGTVNAATDDFEITVTGTGGHAGYPHLAADPVARAVPVRRRAAASGQPAHRPDARRGRVGRGAARRAGRQRHPGDGDRARARSARWPRADREFLRAAVAQTVADTCRAYGCDGTVTITPAEPALVNDPRLTAACQPLLREAGFRVDTEFRSCGADDFSYYSAVVPSVMLFVGSGTDGEPASPAVPARRRRGRPGRRGHAGRVPGRRVRPRRRAWPRRASGASCRAPCRSPRRTSRCARSRRCRGPSCSSCRRSSSCGRRP